MGRIVATLLSAAMLCSSIGASSATSRRGMDWGPSSLRLSEGMTEQEAITAVGYPPNKAEQQTCGTEAASGPWTCRILTFGNSYSNLTVVERDEGDATIGHFWVVNHWVVSD
jgi:hypothetical protein